MTNQSKNLYLDNSLEQCINDTEELCINDTEEQCLDESLDDNKDSSIINFKSIINTLSGFKTNITSLQNDIKKLEKIMKKEIKGLEKKNEKNKNKGNKKPSGFAKPAKISNKLSKFLNKDNTIEVARTEVTQHIIKYIQDNKLQNPNNLKQINPDDKLKNLLEITEEDELTFFNIQKYMNKHFISAL